MKCNSQYVGQVVAATSQVECTSVFSLKSINDVSEPKNEWSIRQSRVRRPDSRSFTCLCSCAFVLKALAEGIMFTSALKKTEGSERERATGQESGRDLYGCRRPPSIHPAGPSPPPHYTLAPVRPARSVRVVRPLLSHFTRFPKNRGGGRRTREGKGRLLWSCFCFIFPLKKQIFVTKEESYCAEKSFRENLKMCQNILLEVIKAKRG